LGKARNEAMMRRWLMTRSSEFYRYTRWEWRLISSSVIAVQGLGASPYYTWVKKVPREAGSQEVKEIMWLRDLLPSYVARARIATFSYLSDWYTYRRGVRTSIRELGEQLLSALHQDRQRIGVRFGTPFAWGGTCC
jgi:hypothetical protein